MFWLTHSEISLLFSQKFFLKLLRFVAHIYCVLSTVSLVFCSREQIWTSGQHLVSSASRRLKARLIWSNRGAVVGPEKTPMGNRSNTPMDWWNSPDPIWIPPHGVALPALLSRFRDTITFPLLYPQSCFAWQSYLSKRTSFPGLSENRPGAPEGACFHKSLN